MKAMSTAESSALASAIQRRFPLAPDPWSALADETGLMRSAVLGQVERWLEGGELREVSAVFEGEALGYDSALVAVAVADQQLEAVARGVARHPTVTHCYERNHATNLWFTLAVPPEMGLEATLGLLAAETGVDPAAFHPLRRGHTFKIGVSFDLESRRNDTQVALGDASQRFSPNAREVAMVRALQTPLPARERPFAALAEQAEVSTDELLGFAHRLLGTALRRYVATFRHRKLGVRGNGMAVWRVAEEDVRRVGERLASAPEVSHCYSRPPFPGFDYSLYSMIHGPDEPAVRRVAAELAESTGVGDYDVLFSQREFKKTRLRYYLPELTSWWAQRAGQAS
jgi:DNA-binding Lrp family transcriptional regulator